MPAGVSVLPVPALKVSNVWVQVTVSSPARLPDVIVGTPVELIVPSHTFVSVAAVAVIDRLVISPVASSTSETE